MRAFGLLHVPAFRVQEGEIDRHPGCRGEGTASGNMAATKKLTKTQKRDMRENASLAVSVASLMVGLASFALVLNRKQGDGGTALYSEKKGRIKL